MSIKITKRTDEDNEVTTTNYLIESVDGRYIRITPEEAHELLKALQDKLEPKK